MSIQQLPQDVVAQIKSSTTITSLNEVVCGLVKNSFDAGASKLTVSVDYTRGNCSVEDNGTGIPPAEFAPGGGLGRLHCTSRFPARAEVHGRSGAFLASLGALSLLSITSRHQGYHSHNSIKIHNSDVLARRTPSPPDQRLLSFIHGTRVTVRDLFGSMPVRVKQRPVSGDKSTTARDWELLKRAIGALLLAWPGSVSISLRDSANNQAALIKGCEESNVRSDRGRPSGLTSKVSSIVLQAGLADENFSESWVRLKAATEQLSITGVVSLMPVATKRAQFMSIGIEPVSNERGSNVLYEEVNRLFSNSSFGVEEAVDVAEEGRRRAEDRRYKSEGYTANDLKARKGIDRWPMFYVRINLNEPGNQTRDVEEVLDERRHSLNSILEVLKAMMFEFLKKHYFRPRHFKVRRDDFSSRSNARNEQVNPVSRSDTSMAQHPTGSTKHSRKRFMSDTRSNVGDLAVTNLKMPRHAGSPSNPDSPFDAWPRIKRGRSSQAYESTALSQSGAVQCPPGDEARDTGSETPPSLLDADGKLTRAPFIDVDDQPVVEDCVDTVVQQASKVLPSEHNDFIIWVNPDTKKRTMIDPRTGFVMDPPKVSRDGVIANSRPSRLTSRQKAPSKAPTLTSETGAWLRDLLASWENPVFEAAELPIPMANDETKLLSSIGSGTSSGCHGCHLPSRGTASDLFQNVGGRVSRGALRVAEIVAQVDRKFILAKVPLEVAGKKLSGIQSDAAPVLIIFDQHAADERCRVEELMRDYFKPSGPSGWKAQTELLNKPIKYEITVHEASLFERYLSYFEQWGIIYQLQSMQSVVTAIRDQRSSCLRIARLPPSIIERCRLEPRVLIELLRKEVWRLAEQGVQPRPPDATSTQPSWSEGRQQPESHWLSRFHGCPQGILDMINSRACRSAIMFNDVLSRDDCAGLLARLADCAFPFQCAHGRPSMVPLVDLGNRKLQGSGGGDEKPEGAASFGRAFKKWKAAGGGGGP